MYNTFYMIVRYLAEEEEARTVIECSTHDKDSARKMMKKELANFKDYRILSAVLCERVEKIM